MVVKQGTKTVTKTVTVEEPTGEYVITLDEPQLRRLRRIVGGHAGLQDVYHGPRTDKFAAELAEALDYTQENARPRSS